MSTVPTSTSQHQCFCQALSCVVASFTALVERTTRASLSHAGLGLATAAHENRKGCVEPDFRELTPKPQEAGGEATCSIRPRLFQLRPALFPKSKCRSAYVQGSLHWLCRRRRRNGCWQSCPAIDCATSQALGADDLPRQERAGLSSRTTLMQVTHQAQLCTSVCELLLAFGLIGWDLTFVSVSG